MGVRSLELLLFLYISLPFSLWLLLRSERARSKMTGDSSPPSKRPARSRGDTLAEDSGAAAASSPETPLGEPTLILLLPPTFLFISFSSPCLMLRSSPRAAFVRTHRSRAVGVSLQAERSHVCNRHGPLSKCCGSVNGQLLALSSLCLEFQLFASLALRL